MNKLQEVSRNLRPGRVYRRADLIKWSKSVDRHLLQLLENKTLTKLSGGLYYCPKITVFGKAPADERELIKVFLKDDRFLLTSLNAYNSLGLGISQLYNETIVYNHKRHGRFKFAGRSFDFRIVSYFPKKITEEFLFVDLANNLDRLAENTTRLHAILKAKLTTLNKNNLIKAVKKYGNLQSRKLFYSVLANNKKVSAA